MIEEKLSTCSPVTTGNETSLAPQAPGILDLARLPGQTLLTEDALARCLGVTKRTVRPMVSRY